MFDDIIFTTYGRGKIDKNWHISDNIGFNRIYYIHSGDVWYSGSGIREKLETGYVYLFPQNLKFDLEFEEDEVIDHTYFDFVLTPPIRLEKFMKIDIEENKIIGLAAKVLLELGEKYGVGVKEYREIIKSYLKNFLVLVNKETRIEIIEDERINDAIKYIHKNINKEITLEELASMECIETNYFIKIFKKNMYITPYQYIKNYRMTRAASYLERNCPVGEVASKVGYSDVAAFSHAFKKEYGIYPSEYIKNKKHS